jgi:hypothetical protein
MTRHFGLSPFPLKSVRENFFGVLAALVISLFPSIGASGPRFCGRFLSKQVTRIRSFFTGRSGSNAPVRQTSVFGQKGEARRRIGHARKLSLTAFAWPCRITAEGHGDHHRSVLMPCRGDPYLREGDVAVRLPLRRLPSRAWQSLCVQPVRRIGRISRARRN